MNKFNKDFWSERYSTGDTGWDLGNVSTPLKEYIDQIKDKNIRILIPGAGNSYEAEYLFTNGFTNVFVIDIVEQPLKNIQERLPSFPKENLICGDFFELEMTFDLILEQTFFCALDKSLRQQYVIKMNQLLSPGGKLVGVYFTSPLDTDHPPFAASQEEYKELFSPHFNIRTMEPCFNSIAPRSGRELFINVQKN